MSDNEDRPQRNGEFQLRLLKPLVVITIALSPSVGMPLDDQHSVLLPKSAVAEVASLYPKSGSKQITGSWEASGQDLNALEANLEQVSVLSRSKNQYQRIDHPEHYFRQYVPIIQGGQKRIYVNAFCGTDIDRPPRYWRDRLVIIADGGSCVWQATYDVESGKFLELSVNGRA